MFPSPTTPTRLTARARTVKLATLAALAVAMPWLQGCAIKPPEAWDKGLLARPEMTMAADPLDQRFSQHIYSSKEAASGGGGVGGGGCGCN